jgi:hypothetical protein
MFGRMFKFLTIPALALVALVACSEQVAGPLDPQQSPSFSRSLDEDQLAIANGLKPRFEEAGAFVEQTIGPEGGFLYIDLHYLYVPEGAVRRPTVFRMTTWGDGRIGADLTATSVRSDEINDVGKKGFRKPVYLYFSYEHAPNAPHDPSLIQVVWVKDSGELVAQPTQVYQDHKIAVGTLDHFSDYALAWPSRTSYYYSSY